MIFLLGKLEDEGESAPNGARRIHKVDRLPVLPQDGNISLGQQILRMSIKASVVGRGVESAGG